MNLSVSLSVAPIENVTVSLSSTNSDITFSPTSLTFSTTNGTTGQTVTVSAAHDNDATDDSATITLSASSEGINASNKTVSVNIDDDDVAGTILLSPAGMLTIPEGDSRTLTVMLSTAPNANVTVSLAKTNADITLSPTSLTFSTGNWSDGQTVTVSASEDDDHTNDNDTITLSATGGIIAPNVTKSVRVTDDDSLELVLDKTSLTFDEGGSGEFKVKLGTRPSANVTVSLTSNDTSVTIDQTQLNFAQSGSAWMTYQTVRVSSAHDDDTNDISTTIGLSAAGGDYAGKTKSVTVNVTDDDEQRLDVDTGSISLAEGSGTTSTFDVKLATKPDSDVSVTVVSSDANAVSVSPSSLTFTSSNWDEDQTVTVAAEDDSDGTDENVTLTINATSNYAAAPNVTKSVSVTDDDGEIDVSAAAVTIDEGDTGTFNVHLDAPPASSATLSVSSGDTDLATVSPATLTFSSSNWDDDQTVTVTGVDDADAENETVTITIRATGGYRAADETKSITVTDDEAKLVIDDDDDIDLSEGQTGDLTGTVTVKLSRSPSSTATVSITSADPSAVSVSPSTLTFDPDDDSDDNYSTGKTVTLTAESDPDGTDEAVDITLSISGTGTVPSTKTVKANVSDDDGDIMASAEAVNITEDGGSTGTFTVKLGAPPASSATFSVTSRDTAAVTASPATLTFTSSNHATEQTVTLTPVSDPDGTNDTVNITIAATAGYTADDEAKSITVVDDDGSIVVSSPTVRIDEGAQGKTFTVKLGAAPASSATLSLRSAHTTLVDVSPEMLTFSSSNWDTTQPVTVTAKEDDDGTNESVNIELKATDGYTADDVIKAISVVDDDRMVEVDSDLPTLAEGGDADTIEVNLATKPISDVTVSVTSGDTQVLTLSPSTLTFMSSEYDDDNVDPKTVTKRVTLTPVEDDDARADTVPITLSVESGYDDDTADKKINITVNDNDTESIEIGDEEVSLEEGGDAGTFTVKLGAAPAGENATFSVTSGEPSAVTVSPATLTFSRANWNSTQEISVTPVEDNNDSESETVIIIVKATAGYDNAEDGMKSVSVADNEVSGDILLDPASLTIGEGGRKDFRVKLDEEPVKNVTVTLSSSNSDITLDKTSLVFTPSNWNDNQTVVVDVSQDLDADDETYNITLAASGGFISQGTTLTVNVTDDDMVAIVVGSTPASLAEGGDSAVFTVKLGSAISNDVDVTVSSSDTGAVAVSESSLTFTSSNWDTERRVILSPVDDDNVDDETVTITLEVDDDDDYDADPVPRNVTVTDDDEIAIVPSSTALFLTEGSAAATFTVRLDSAPPATGATLSVTSGDQSVATVSPATLTFTPSNYRTQQEVSVTTMDDSDAGDETISITLSATGYDADDVEIDVDVEDDEVLPTGTIVLDKPDTLHLDEGASGDIKVKLEGIAPISDVTVSLTNSDSGAVMASGSSLSESSLTFTPANYSTEQTVTLASVDDDDFANESVTIILSASGGTSARRVAKRILVEDDDKPEGEILLDPDGTMNIAPGGSQEFTVRLDRQPKADVTVSLSNDHGDVTLSPKSLTFTVNDWIDPQNVEVSVAPVVEEKTEVGGEMVPVLEDTIAVSADDVGISADSVAKAVAIDYTPPPSANRTIVVEPETLRLDEGASASFTVRLKYPEDDETPPSENVNLSLAHTNADITLSSRTLVFTPTSLSTDPPASWGQWDGAITVSVDALADSDTVNDHDIIVLSADGFIDRKLAVEVKDNSGIDWPTKAWALALPPPTVQDDATLRVRCKQATPCSVYLDCGAQSDDSIFQGVLPEPIPAYGSLTLTAADIRRYTGGVSWEGKGRLGCALRSAGDIGAQVWTRSGDGVLVNNSAMIRSVPEGDRHRADIESISSPDSPDKANIRIHCVAPVGKHCTDTRFACYDDHGSLFDFELGRIKRQTVRHLQSEDVADRIIHRWRDMGLACEVRSDSPFTVQVLSRTGGGGALVNNSAGGN